MSSELLCSLIRICGVPFTQMNSEINAVRNYTEICEEFSLTFVGKVSQTNSS